MHSSPNSSKTVGRMVRRGCRAGVRSAKAGDGLIGKGHHCSACPDSIHLLGSDRLPIGNDRQHVDGRLREPRSRTRP